MLFQYISMLLFALFVSYPLSARAQALEPLPDLTVDTLAYQMTRCSAFYSAMHSLISEELMKFQDQETETRLRRILKQTEKNSDGLLLSSTIVRTVLENKSDRDAVDEALDSRNGMIPKYLGALSSQSLGLGDSLESQLWANDGAACYALVEQVEPIIERLTSSSTRR
ncbi:hypothetical protein [Pseudooceanicola nanhaiensis]|uniref:hypothetical protein n=1 Tax=Pseudooceanicola nanhaiensis TaxID=375761 RepID=UPI001CD61E6C|nr:hypothetical protein [Pseudooceanicola nanhaiensis]MCA0920232.1 hypothetical protein [Pseudooceanicola nanhaiensis]